jgi:hypothetical protein
MSKMDDMRAMREARFGQAAPRATSPAATPKKAQPARPKAAAPSSASGPETSEPRLCGHRAISGRTCTREHGHEAKSHRYS